MPCYSSVGVVVIEYDGRPADVVIALLSVACTSAGAIFQAVALISGFHRNNWLR
jgi:hypothetical protein